MKLLGRHKFRKGVVSRNLEEKSWIEKSGKGCCSGEKSDFLFENIRFSPAFFLENQPFPDKLNSLQFPEIWVDKTPITTLQGFWGQNEASILKTGLNQSVGGQPAVYIRACPWSLTNRLARVLMIYWLSFGSKFEPKTCPGYI